MPRGFYPAFLRRPIRHTLLNLLALSFYGGSVVAPLLHALEGIGEASCEACLSRQSQGPSFDARCDEGCDDPSHHHHHAHHSSSCILCQKVRGTVASLELPSALLASSSGVPCVTSAFDRLATCEDDGATPIRGPPCLQS